MKSQAAVRRIVEELKVLYPDARCSLTYEKDYELLFAVRLSAQCTDARVNTVTAGAETAAGFECFHRRYKNAFELERAAVRLL